MTSPFLKNSTEMATFRRPTTTLCFPVRYHQVALDGGIEGGRQLLKVQCARIFDSAVESEAGGILPV